MERRGVLRGMAALLTWLPVGVLLSASECETDEEIDRRRANERMWMEMSMRWNAQRQKELAEKQAAELKKLQEMQIQLFGPAPPPLYRSGRNPDEPFHFVPDFKL
jgi:hypothetical protein